ncbi:hypothetical protein O185_27470 [Photorhabdus temperata J3]|uniref:Uncharacterized protein n=1 Tax=Photorhabdus temperata J3 TaxID=1389415 RepID=U7QS38_PHOTE|nr:hypothetical protein O185_27470 [Photorhabdus temperata J3]
MSQITAQGHQNGRSDTDKTGITEQGGKIVMMIFPNVRQIKMFKITVMRHVKEDQDGHDFTGIHVTLSAAQTVSVIETKLRPLRDEKPAKIVGIAENFN